MSSTSIKLVVASAMLLGLAVQGFAQGGATGAITGTVQDPSGAVVANADVRVTNQDTGVVERALKTGPDGSFTAQLLPVGTYTVSVQAPGFTEGKFADFVVLADDPYTLVRSGRCRWQRRTFSNC